MDVLTLGRSETVTVHDVRCSTSSPRVSDEEEEPSFSIAVPMTGVFVHRCEGRALVGVPGVAVQMNPGDAHRTSHPAGGGDRTIELVLSDEAADPWIDAATDRFADRVVRVPPMIDLETRSIARAAGRGDLTVLELDERVQRVLSGLFDRATHAPTSARRRAIVDRALEYLSSHYAEDADLPSVAAAVGCSPHHLSRAFHAGAGITLSGYRMELRVRAALERMESGASDLSAVASDVGFFDHAHMTRTFRRLLERTPSQIRARP